MNSRHPRRRRVPRGDGRGLHAPRDRGRARPLTTAIARPIGCASNGSTRAARARRARRGGATRDLVVARCALVQGPAADCRGPRRAGRGRPATGRRSTVLVPDRATSTRTTRPSRLAAAVAGAGLTVRGPSREPRRPARGGAGVLHVRVGELERLNGSTRSRCSPRSTGTIVATGSSSRQRQGRRRTSSRRRRRRRRPGGRGSAAGPPVWVAPFIPRRVAVVVKEAVRGLARERFERASGRRSSRSARPDRRSTTCPTSRRPCVAAVAPFERAPDAADLILTAGGRSTDPRGSVLRGRRGARRRGRPPRRAGPSGLDALAGARRRTPMLGLPTCGAYSKATAADLLLPRLLTGEPPTRRTVADLGHGGMLTRDCASGSRATPGTSTRPRAEPPRASPADAAGPSGRYALIGEPEWLERQGSPRSVADVDND